MDGEDSLDVLIEIKLAVLDLEQCRNHTGLPVVAVDDIRLEVQMLQGINDRTGEEAETLIFVAAESVNIRTAKVILIIDKVECNTLILQGADAAVLLAPAEDYFEFTFELHLSLIGLGNLSIERQNHADIFPAVFKNGGQSADNVSQSAGLNKGNAFRCGKQQFQYKASFRTVT